MPADARPQNRQEADYARELAAKELPLLQERREAVRRSLAPAPSPMEPLEPGKEPAFDFLHNLTGLGLSGGGIRSAAFNLGLLQVLASRKLLGLIDVLCTVSGGGYVGSMLAALNDPARLDGTGRAPFPANLHGEAMDPDLLRKLRARSSYLAPQSHRRGSDLLAAGLLALRGFLVHMAFAGVFAGLLLMPFLTPGSPGLGAARWLGGTTVVLAGLCGFPALLFAIHAIETIFPACARHRDRWQRWALILLLPAALALCREAYQLVTGLVDGGLRKLVPAGADGEVSMGWKAALWVAQVTGVYGLLGSAGRSGGGGRRWLAVILALLSLAGVLVFFAWLSLHGPREIFVHRLGWSAGDAARRLAAFSSWIFAGLCLYAGFYLIRKRTDGPRSGPGLAFLAAGFCAIPIEGGARYWMQSPLFKVLGAVPLLTWCLVFAAVVVLLLTSRRAGALRLLCGLGLAALLFAFPLLSGICGTFDDPFTQLHVAVWTFFGVLGFGATFFLNLNRTSLHNYYREHLAELFLSDVAGLPCDPPLVDLVPKVAGGLPLPVVACALNLPQGVESPRNGGWDLTEGRKGDSFAATPLSIGSRILDQVGPGEYAKGGQPLRLSTVMAVSGAAVSSRSLNRLPPLLGALLTLFNIRLGYWLPNPRHLRAKAQPGGLGFVERLSLQKPFWPGLFLRELTGSFDDRNTRVLLSDGGHFDNLGLYELVRRRCRYIVLSDASADPLRAFADLGETLQRCRVDHRTEIELDVDVLKPDPATGLSARHAVAGEIVYPEGSRGILIYIKSSLTGDEPEDVRAYGRAHPAFPHESTADQFFDEAQFEAYRRLGEHVAEEVLGAIRSARVGAIFRDLRDRWQPPPHNGGERFLDLCKDFMDLEGADLLQAPNLLDQEQFPELTEEVEPSRPDEPRTLHHVARQLQLMENFHLALKLDLAANREHPANRGAMNLFRRWAKSTTFRRHWRVLRSLYGKAFQQFAEEHLDLPSNREPAAEACLRVERVADWRGEGMAWMRRCLRYEGRMGEVERDLGRLSLIPRAGVALHMAFLPMPGAEAVPLGGGFTIGAPASPGRKRAELFCVMNDNRFHHMGVTAAVLRSLLDAHPRREFVVLPLWAEDAGRWDLAQWKDAKAYFARLGFRQGLARRGQAAGLDAAVLDLAGRAPRPPAAAQAPEVPYAWLPARDGLMAPAAPAASP